jgi:hypothetical protein
VRSSALGDIAEDLERTIALRGSYALNPGCHRPGQAVPRDVTPHPIRWISADAVDNPLGCQQGLCMPGTRYAVGAWRHVYVICQPRHSKAQKPAGGVFGDRTIRRPPSLWGNGGRSSF